MSEFHLSKRVLVVLIIIVLVLIGAIGAYTSYLFSNHSVVVISPETASEENFDTAVVEPLYVEPLSIPLMTDFHFVEDSSFLDLNDVFDARSDETDRKHYYTLLANSEMTHEEAMFVEAPELPTVMFFEEGDREIGYEVVFPENATYDIETVTMPTVFNEVTFGGITLGELLAPENEWSIYLSLMQDDLQKLTASVNDTYGDYVTSPLLRVLGEEDGLLSQTEFTYPPAELVILFAYKQFLTDYIDPSYHENTVSDFVTSNVLNQKFLQSDIAAAQVLSTQYMQVAADRLAVVLSDNEPSGE